MPPAQRVVGLRVVESLGVEGDDVRVAAAVIGVAGATGLRGQAPVVLARTVDDFSNFREIFAPYVSMVGADAVGSVLVCKDEDEVIRRFDEFLCDEGRSEALPSLAGIMARHLGVERPWRGWIDYGLGEPMPYIRFRDAVRMAEALRAEMTYLTHLTHRVTHEQLLRELPAHVRPAYDGLVVEV